jgi:type I restriction enzyme S subunit
MSSVRFVPVGGTLVRTRRDHKIQKRDYLPEGQLPIIDQGSEFIGGWADDLDLAYRGELPVVVFGDHTCCFKYVDRPFAVGADGTQILRPSDDWDVRYFYYCLLTTSLEQFGYQRHFKYLKEAEIPLRPMDEQRRIAVILSAYDDLIENNARRIQILEDIAQVIYREWFVEKRFPPGQTHGVLSSADWRRRLIGDLGRVVTGATPSTGRPELWGASIPFITPSDLHRSRPWVSASRYISNSGALELATRLLPAGAVCFTCIASIGASCMTQEVSLTNQQINSLIVEDNEADPFFVFQKLVEDKERIKAMASGAATPIINKTAFSSIALDVPPLTEQCRFGEEVEPLYRMVALLEARSSILRTTRDILVPRLISGEVDVSHLDIDTAGLLA